MKIKEKPEIFFIFFRFLGKPWQKIEDLELKLLDLSIESGCIFIFVKKEAEKKFLLNI
jgi:hypothetical protein